MCLISLNSTEGMWDHVKAKHMHEINDEKKIGPKLGQPMLNFAMPQKFSKEKHQVCYKSAVEASILILLTIHICYLHEISIRMIVFFFFY